ncbi:hypothetical protein BO71DRAFT_487375, partial [Aspergillus ellipticus CBS 707.79]
MTPSALKHFLQTSHLLLLQSSTCIPSVCNSTQLNLNHNYNNHHQRPSSLTMAIRSESAMILRDLSAFNMGRGAYDTTGVKKP